MFLTAFSILNGQNKSEREGVIIGVKIYEQRSDYKQLFSEWKDLGINTAYVSVDLAYDMLFREEALENEVDVYIVFPVFFNPEVLKERPDWYAITQYGAKAKEEWVAFVSPSNKEYCVQRAAFVQKVVRDTEPDGISIDFIRYFAYWEKIYEGRTLESIPDSSFDSMSLAFFQAEQGIKIPKNLLTVVQKSEWILENYRDSWVDWKCSNIVSMVKNIVTSVKDIQPEIRTNLHVVPWRENDFEGAIKKIVGQDLSQLSKYVDFISPMCYSHMLKRDAEWVSSVVNDFNDQTVGTSILPSIQVQEAYLENVLDEKEFTENLKAALQSPSKGVVFWSWAHLEKNPTKKEIIKKWVN